MEIDDLKKIWNESQPDKKATVKIMEIIQRKDGGPLESLKRSYRKQIFVMSIMPVLLILSNLSNVDKVFTSVLFWSYVLFCIGVIIFARVNYNIVSEMQRGDIMVKDNLNQQIMLLEKRSNLEILGLRSALIFFIVLIEVLPFFQHYRMLDKWNSLEPVYRIGAYLFILALQHVMIRKVKHRKVGRHLEDLKILANQMN
jgi:hypothetical protein